MLGQHAGWPGFESRRGRHFSSLYFVSRRSFKLRLREDSLSRNATTGHYKQLLILSSRPTFTVQIGKNFELAGIRTRVIPLAGRACYHSTTATYYKLQYYTLYIYIENSFHNKLMKISIKLHPSLLFPQNTKPPGPHPLERHSGVFLSWKFIIFQH